MKRADFAARVIAVAVAAAFFVFGFGESKAQQGGLAGSWQQVSSNAGDCPTCQIEIKPRGTAPGVFDVIANNGWSAQVKAGPGDAEGMGQWTMAADGSQPGQAFSLILRTNGSQLALRMRIGVGAAVEGQFVRAGGAAPTAAAAPRGEFKAGSWGRIVRAGPGMDFARVTSLPEGEPITVVENAGVMMNGYPWFKIRYRGKNTGYHWGGIMCAVGQPVAGLLDTCPKRASATKPQGPASAKKPVGDVIGPVDFSCDEGIPLRVMFDNRGTTSIATVTHDSILTVRLPQVVSGSGIRYSDGRYTLQSKGNTAIFSWGDGQHSCTKD